MAELPHHLWSGDVLTPYTHILQPQMLSGTPQGGLHGLPTTEAMAVKGNKLSKEDLNELKEIWERDHTVPGIEWRKAWAASHGLTGFANVTQFFKRKQQKDAGRTKGTNNAHIPKTGGLGDSSSSPNLFHDASTFDSSTTPNTRFLLSHAFEFSPATPPPGRADGGASSSRTVQPASTPPPPDRIVHSRDFAPASTDAHIPRAHERSLLPDVPSVLLSQAYGMPLVLSMLFDDEESLDRPRLPSLTWSATDSPAVTSLVDETPSSVRDTLSLPEDDCMRIYPRHMPPSPSPVLGNALWIKLEPIEHHNATAERLSPVQALALPEERALMWPYPADVSEAMNDEPSYSLQSELEFPRPEFYYPYSPEVGLPLDEAHVEACQPLSENINGEMTESGAQSQDASDSCPSIDDFLKGDLYSSPILEGRYGYQTEGQLEDIKRDVERQASEAGEEHWDDLVDTSYRINQALGL